MKRSLTILAISGLAIIAWSTPAFLPTFTKLYKPAAKSALAKARCGACHVGMTAKLNPYGKDLAKISAAKPITVDMLKKAEGLDSDKDGVKNGAELKKGTLPGDPKSK